MRRTLPLLTAIAALTATGLPVATPASADSDPPRCVVNVCVVVVDPGADSDGDGFTDSDERDAGTDPDDPSSRPATIDVIVSIVDRRSASFWQDHHTELIVLPVTMPNGRTVDTGLGRFAVDLGIVLPARSSADRFGLTLHERLGFDLPGITLDPGQSLLSEGSDGPTGQWSLVAGGSPSGSFSTTKITYGKPTTYGTFVDLDAKGNGTIDEMEYTKESNGSVQTVRTSKTVVDGQATGGFTSVSTTRSSDGYGSTTTTTSSRTVDENGTTTSVTDVVTVELSDGSSKTTVFHSSVQPDGRRTVVEARVRRDADGNVIESSSTVTTYDNEGKVVAQTTTTSCKDSECEEYWDPELSMAMGWTTVLTADDFRRVAARITSTITTVEGWEQPNVDPDEPPVTASPHGPLVALIDPESAVTVFAVGAPRFTSVQPDYDPYLLEQIVLGALPQLPPDTSLYRPEP